MKFIDITREPSPLVQWHWRFWYFERSHALVLDSYATLERPTKRHKFNVTESYNRLGRGGVIKESEVVLPADVVAEALKQFCDNLKVVRWSDAK